MCPLRRTKGAASTRWSREQIQAARRAELAPLLRANGFDLYETGGENYILRQHPDIIVKRCFWRSTKDDHAACPEQRRGGNAIDFFVGVLGMSFSQAMEVILKG